MLEGIVPFPPEFQRAYREKGYWRDKPLRDEFAELFKEFADRVAIIDKGRIVRTGVTRDLVEEGASEVEIQASSDREDLEAAVAGTVDRFGRLDCCIHNAVGGASRPVAVEDVEPHLIDDLMATTVRASFDLAQVAHPHLVATAGSFVMMTSAAGMEGSPNVPAYAMVKASQRALAKSLAGEWGSSGVRVNCIAPIAMTPAMASAFRANPDLESRLAARTPLGRIGDPAADIGPVAVFLASDLSRFVTGQTVVADGGGFLGL